MTAKALERYDQSLANPYATTTDAAPPAPTLSARVMQALPEVMRDLGLNAAQLLRECGLETTVFAGAERRVSFPELERLFRLCEAHAACDHVGLLLGSRTRLDDLGLAAKVARRCSNAGEALRELVEHCNLHDTPATASLHVAGNHARFAWSLNEHCLVDARHFDYAGTAISYNILQDLFGTRWQPTAVRFTSRPPADRTAFESCFAAPLEFVADRSEIVFDSSWLAQPLPALDPAALAGIAVELQQARNDAMTDLPATLRRVLRKRLLLGDFSMDDVAAQLSMHRRTLDRRLQRCSTTYGELLEGVRDDIARQLLRETQFSIQRVAESVRFSSAANFATAFRRRAGMTPTEYRRATS